MSTTPQTPYVREESRLGGVIIFGAVMMMVLGFFEVVMGLTALFQDDYFDGQGDVLVFSDNFTLWGWSHIALGVLVIVAGSALLQGRMWGRVVGVAVALVTAVVNMAFVGTAPIWSLSAMALSLLVVYAIVAHGGDFEL